MDPVGPASRLRPAGLVNPWVAARLDLLEHQTDLVIQAVQRCYSVVQMVQFGHGHLARRVV